MPDKGLDHRGSMARDAVGPRHLDWRQHTAAFARTRAVFHDGCQGARDAGHDAGLPKRVSIESVVRPVRTPSGGLWTAPDSTQPLPLHVVQSDAGTGTGADSSVSSSDRAAS